MALELYQKSLKLNEEMRLKGEIARNLIGIGQTYRLKGYYAQALESAERAVTVARQIESREILYESLAIVLLHHHGDHPHPLRRAFIKHGARVRVRAASVNRRVNSLHRCAGYWLAILERNDREDNVYLVAPRQLIAGFCKTGHAFVTELVCRLVTQRHRL